MAGKPDWLKATRTVGGEEVVNMRLLRHQPGDGGWYSGLPYLSGEIRRNGFLYSCAWNPANGHPIEQFAKYTLQTLSLASIPAEPEPVCVPPKCPKCRGRGEYKDNFAGVYFECECAPAKPVVKVGQRYRDKDGVTLTIAAVTTEGNGHGTDSKGHGRRTTPRLLAEGYWTLVSEAPEPPVSGCAKGGACDMQADGNCLPCGDVPAEADCAGGYDCNCHHHPMPVAPEWKPTVGKGALYGRSLVQVRGFSSDGKRVVFELESGEILAAPLADLRKPAPKTRDVVVREYAWPGSDKRMWLDINPVEGWVKTGRTHTFSVPVDDNGGDE
jgi:hypothetical protein